MHSPTHLQLSLAVLLGKHTAALLQLGGALGRPHVCRGGLRVRHRQLSPAVTQLALQGGRMAAGGVRRLPRLCAPLSGGLWSFESKDVSLSTTQSGRGNAVLPAQTEDQHVQYTCALPSFADNARDSSSVRGKKEGS